MDTFVTVFISLAAIRLVGLELVWQAAKRKGGKLIFSTGILYRSIHVVGALMVSVMLFHPQSNVSVWTQAWFMQLAVFLMLVLVVANWPVTIVLDDEGVHEHRWGGLRSRTVEWDDVLHAVWIELPSEYRRECQIILKEGKPIVHTGLHVSPEKFRQEVGRHVEVHGGPPREL